MGANCTSCISCVNFIFAKDRLSSGRRLRTGRKLSMKSSSSSLSSLVELGDGGDADTAGSLSSTTDVVNTPAELSISSSLSETSTSQVEKVYFSER